ncbi:MAG: hypothetical protein ACKVT0_03485 [Planctomycetaceae bacterium]
MHHPTRRALLLMTIVLSLSGVITFADDEKKPWSDYPVPDIGVRTEDLAPIYGKFHFVWVRESKIPGCFLDLLCYEHSQVTLVDSRAVENGAFELRHRSNDHPHVLLITTVTPQPGAVEFLMRAEVDRAIDANGKLPNELPSPNLCFRVKRAEDCFSSHPHPFPEFIGRCFIFTEAGQTFLLDAPRFPLPRAAADDLRNNPPWVQQYYPVWQPLPEESTGMTWYNRSTSRFTVPVMGIVSRDKKYLTAIANDTSDLMTQAWQECLHNNPKWSPADAPPEEQRWRVKIYIMPNDPDLLLERVGYDFPEALKLKEKAVP